MARICPLFSGSTGNSTYVAYKGGAVLIDAGGSLKSIISALENAGGSLEEISALLITHEHSDHIKGIRPFLNKCKVPLIASEKTLAALISGNKIPAGVETVAIDCNNGMEVGGAVINRFATSHDCEGSSGYTLELPEGVKFSLCTDLGIVTDEVRNTIKGSKSVLIESNHDVEMLKKGPYPPDLKVRIMSDNGHISNNVCSAELAPLLNSGTDRFILGHLSQNNNTPLLALSVAEAALMDVGAKNNRDYVLMVAGPKNNRVTVL